MTPHAAFIRAIAAEPCDDTHRLVFADWLDENGEPERAELIRVQGELEPMRDRYEFPRACQLHEREDDLLRQHQKEWLGKMPKEWDHYEKGTTIEFRRGFPDLFATPVPTFLDQGPAILKRHPTIRRIVLFRVHGHGERLAACPALEGSPNWRLPAGTPTRMPAPLRPRRTWVGCRCWNCGSAVAAG